MKILCTGDHKSPVAQAIKKRWTDTVFCSREASKIDLTTENGLNIFLYLSQQYDVVINAAKLKNYYQSILLRELWKHWNKLHKVGHIISIGSDILYKVGSLILHAPEHSIVQEKQALSDVHRKYCLVDPYIKMTLINPGRIEHDSYILPDELAEMIKWVLDKPVSRNINEITMSAPKR